MEWKNAEEFQPPLNTKILVKVSPSISNEYYGRWPGKAVLAGQFVSSYKEEFKKLENGLYEKVVAVKRYFDEVDPDRWSLDDNEFEWTEFSE